LTFRRAFAGLPLTGLRFRESRQIRTFRTAVNNELKAVKALAYCPRMPIDDDQPRSRVAVWRLTIADAAEVLGE
jgi:hypothetical protein